ncbi:DUF4012 domain-containing protein [Patescibacteria group bacterium]|nr:DUF4012 domain-containing protein [Patescibacteria group bacterium]MBU0776714.1 DUF4012 domain-containing protein [Patescibacteria group bacterium]MBU0846158.1 DUF4012 domain-containing protein [Patescibacteria group bacterium]MBU0922753.1 DUF4012 domain-containing protein [Patescibacteria group bacterium]MBU1066270.1 DUF4012 domain-containing protein [Patescibacteria group bacterium]
MTDSSMLPFDQRPVVIIYADPSALAVAFVESLVAGLSRVRIISNEGAKWRKQINHLAQNTSVEVVSGLQKSNLGNSNYLVFIHCDENTISDQKTLKEKKKYLEQVAALAMELQAKVLVVLPYYQDSYENILFDQSAAILTNKDLIVGLVCLGELFGPRMSFSSNGIVTTTIKDAIGKSALKEYRYIELYPTYIPDAARGLVKSLFSFGSMGTTSLMYSKKISASKFTSLLKDIVSREVHAEVYAPESKISPKLNTTINLKTDLKQALTETLDWFKQYGQVPLPVIKKKQVVKPIKPAKPKRSFQIDLPKLEKKRLGKTSKAWAWGTILVIMLLIFSPAFLVLSSSSLWVAMNQALSGREALAQTALTFSSVTSGIARRQAGVYAKIPVVGKLYEPVVFLSSFVQRLSLLGEKGLVVFHSSSQIVQKSLAGESYDIQAYSENIALELDLLYREMGFLQSEVEDGNKTGKKYAEKILDKLDFGALRGKILSAKQIAESLPVILGSDASVKYLILFQNNMELRPTGGFIGSFALISFKEGKIIDLNVSDVYTADGQLKGHIEPPTPIKNYLGEANWFLRDSNWDPDFPSSATTVEWFLEKEIGESVDGVIAVDLEFARELINEMGPVYLADFGKEIDSDNLYEITQYEVEKDFFPGSQKKATFLTALARELMDDLINMPSNKYIDIGKAISKSLDEKHIQLFLHNKNTQRAIADMGWDGGVYQPTCSGNCYADWLGIIDANVGVNKANYFIERSSTLNVTMSEGEIIKDLTILIENSASPALGNDAIYKNYLRVLAPQKAYFSDIEILDMAEKELVAPEVREVRGRKEAGVYVEVGPGHSKSITFSWKEKIDLSFNTPGEYRLYWRKQAGTISDKISTNFILPSTITPYGQESLSLTDEGILVYNTNLARDHSSRIFW